MTTQPPIRPIAPILDAIKRAHAIEPDARRAARLLRIAHGVRQAHDDLLDAIDAADDAIARGAARREEAAQ